MRLSFVPLSKLRRRKAELARITSLTAEIELLERALASVKTDGHAPAAYGPAQHLRSSILVGELAKIRAELEVLQARIRPTDKRLPETEPRHDVPVGGAEPGPSSSFYSELGRMRARIVLSSLAAVVVLLGVAKLPPELAPEAQASSPAPAYTTWDAPSDARSSNSISAPRSEVTTSAPLSHASQDPISTRSPVSVVTVDYFEERAASAP